jgi:purine-binding chemotaxis protein CheW
VPPMNEKSGRIRWAEVKSRLAQNQAALEGTLLQDERAQEVLRQRAVEFAARRQGPTAAATGARALVFKVGRERYGLDLEALFEVLPFEHCTPVPGAPLELVGVINVHGEIRSVVSLASMLGAAKIDGDAHPGGYVVIVRRGTMEVGLWVDEVERIALVDPEALMLPCTATPARSDRFVRGAAPDGFYLLELSAVLSHPVFQPKGTAAATTDDS